VVTAAARKSDRVLPALVARLLEDDHVATRVLHQLLPGVQWLAPKWWALASSREPQAAAVSAVYDVHADQHGTLNHHAAWRRDHQRRRAAHPPPGRWPRPEHFWPGR
jgi:hypothetical protein